MTAGATAIDATSIGATASALNFARLGVYLELTKPRLTSLAVVSSMVGLYMAGAGPLDVVVLLGTLLGASLIGAGGSALNQYLERDLDARMTRTEERPLPSGRLQPALCLRFGLVTCFLGVLTLVLTTNALTTGIAVLIVALYVLVYTPMKRKSPLNTIVGAVPGALPILMGWTATGEPLTLAAGSLFLIVYLWQLPHFFAICWLYRADYRRAGFRFWPLMDDSGRRAGWQTFSTCVLLVPLTLLPTGLGLTGRAYAIGALVLGMVFVAVAFGMLVRPVRASARAAFLVSVGYLPLLMLLMMIDRVR